MVKRFDLEVVPLAEVPQPCDAEKPYPVVLVVDDERVIADTLSIILSRNGFAAMPAYGGKSALEIAKAIPPDVLLTDVMMPGMTGIELAIALEKRVRDCKVLLFSGQASTMDLVAEARADGHEFAMLTKPIPPDELIRRITECLRGDAPHTVFKRPSADKDDGGVVFAPVLL
jgi:DNA-binding response OmpR family regulator